MAIVQLDLDFVFADKLCGAKNQIQVRGVLDSFQSAFPKLFDHTLFARANLAHVHRYIAMVNAVVGSPARQVSYPRAIEHRLSRRASVVDARPANKAPFDERGFPTGVRESPGERISRLAGADDDCVVLIH